MMNAKEYLIILLLLMVAHLSRGQTIEISSYTINEQGYATIDFEGTPPPKGYKCVFTIVNDGEETLRIQQYEGGCDCTKIKIQKKRIRPNHSTKAIIHWSPDGDTEFSSSVTIKSNAKNHPELWIQLLGNVQKG